MKSYNYKSFKIEILYSGLILDSGLRTPKTSQKIIYRISANSFLGNYSINEVKDGHNVETI